MGGHYNCCTTVQLWYSIYIRIWCLQMPGKRVFCNFDGCHSKRTASFLQSPRRLHAALADPFVSRLVGMIREGQMQREWQTMQDDLSTQELADRINMVNDVHYPSMQQAIDQPQQLPAASGPDAVAPRDSWWSIIETWIVKYCTCSGPKYSSIWSFQYMAYQEFIPIVFLVFLSSKPNQRMSISKLNWLLWIQIR